MKRKSHQCLTSSLVPKLQLGNAIVFEAPLPSGSPHPRTAVASAALLQPPLYLLLTPMITAQDRLCPA